MTGRTLASATMHRIAKVKTSGIRRRTAAGRANEDMAAIQKG